MKLLFTLDAFYNKQLKYEKGRVYEIDNKLGEADRWIKRRVAEEVVEEVVEPVAEPVAELVVESVPEPVVVVELEPEIEFVDETIVNIEAKKENGRGKKRKEKALNESSEIL